MIFHGLKNRKLLGLTIKLNVTCTKLTVCFWDKLKILLIRKKHIVFNLIKTPPWNVYALLYSPIF